MTEKNTNNVDQIRDLIFGSKIKEFESRFTLIEKKLAETEHEFIKRMNDLSVKMQRDAERTYEVLEKKLNNLMLSTQKERNNLRELIDTTEETLRTKISDQNEEFTTNFKVLKKSIDEQHQKLTTHIDTIRRELEAYLNEKIAAYDNDKLSKDMLVQTLIDAAIRIQGTDISAILQEGMETENAKK
jgi:DNA anti-recombination protein RmuC